MRELSSGGEIVCWEALDSDGRLIGYAFAKDIPEAVAEIPGADEMDRYQVFGIIDPQEFKIVNLEVTMHPEMAKEPWTTEITEPDFGRQFLGLTGEQINLSPDGKIDAITDATLSSTWITTGIRDKVEEIVKRVKG